MSKLTAAEQKEMMDKSIDLILSRVPELLALDIFMQGREKQEELVEFLKGTGNIVWKDGEVLVIG